MTSDSTQQTKVPSGRTFTQLASVLDKRLGSYAAAASAAGVGLLASVQPAEAKIIYTPSNVPIPVNGGLIQFDLNHDGVNDFGLSNQSTFGSAAARPPLGLYHRSLRVVPAQASNRILAVQSNGFPCAAKLPAGVAVGGGGHFASTRLLFQVSGDATTQFAAHCPWLDSKGGYLGLKFVVNGETHYGWARVTISSGVSLRGYAYETTPNKSSS